jgi:hypothetical protein
MCLEPGFEVEGLEEREKPFIAIFGGSSFEGDIVFGDCDVVVESGSFEVLGYVLRRRFSYRG